MGEVPYEAMVRLSEDADWQRVVSWLRGRFEERVPALVQIAGVSPRGEDARTAGRMAELSEILGEIAAAPEQVRMARTREKRNGAA